MVGSGRDGSCALGIPDDEVGIGANGNSTLAGSVVRRIVPKSPTAVPVMASVKKTAKRGSSVPLV